MQMRDSVPPHRAEYDPHWQADKLSTVPKFGTQRPRALVAQWTEHRFPKPCAQVRVLPRAPRNLHQFAQQTWAHVFRSRRTSHALLRNPESRTAQLRNTIEPCEDGPLLADPAGAVADRHPLDQRRRGVHDGRPHDPPLARGATGVPRRHSTSARQICDAAAHGNDTTHHRPPPRSPRH
jgi:hypothetical protein